MLIALGFVGVVTGLVLIVWSLIGLTRRPKEPSVVVTTLKPYETRRMTDVELEQFRPTELDSGTWIRVMRTREDQKRKAKG